MVGSCGEEVYSPCPLTFSLKQLVIPPHPIPPPLLHLIENWSNQKDFACPLENTVCGNLFIFIIIYVHIYSSLVVTLIKVYMRIQQRTELDVKYC